MLSVLHRGVSADGIESARSSAGSQGCDRRGSYRPYPSEHLDKADHQLNDSTSPRASLGTAHDYDRGPDDDGGNHNDGSADDNPSLADDHHSPNDNHSPNDLAAAAKQHVRCWQQQLRWHLDHRFGK
jgi:hypothetical protein